MTKTIYISGPITDLQTGLPREGWQEGFLVAEKKLRSMGFKVISPVDIAKKTDEEWHQQFTVNPKLQKTLARISPMPTRGTYITACLQIMNDEALADRLHGVYILGASGDPYAKPGIYHSDGVQMELRMARVLGIPIFSEFYNGNEIDIHLLPVKDGKRLLAGGKFGVEDWSKIQR